jgi:hypothetical protein
MPLVLLVNKEGVPLLFCEDRGKGGKGVRSWGSLSVRWGVLFSLLDLRMSLIYMFLPISCALLLHLKGGFGCALYCSSS